MERTILLTAMQRRRLLDVFGAFAPPVERVDVYGSRACGTARAGSDVDLIVAGPLDGATVRRDALPLFDASDLVAAPPFSPVDGLREWYRPRAVAAARPPR